MNASISPAPPAGRAAAPARRRIVRPLWAVLGPAALALFCLTPVLRTGYISDDIHASLRPGLIRVVGWSFAESVISDLRLSMQKGRFYPLHWVPFGGIHFLLTETFNYKFYIITLVACDVSLLALLLRRLSGSAGFACLAATLTLMLVQLRAYHDPVLSFFGLLQLLVAGTLLSLLALDVYLERRRGAWLVLSVLFYLACLLLYEASYPLFLLHALLAWRRRPVWRDWLRTCRPFVESAAFCVFMSLFLRWLHPLDFSKATVTTLHYQTNPAPGAILGTLLRQTSGVLPLSYFLADPAGLFVAVRPPAAFARWVARWDVLAVVVAAAALCLASLRRVESRPAQGETTSPPPDWTLIALLGALLAVLPALAITLTARYQKEVEFFKPYVPIYVQYFGAGLLLASALRSALAARPAGGCWARWARLTAALAVGLTTGVTYRANCATAEALVSPPGSPAYNKTAFGMGGAWHHHRLNLQAALRSGLMEDVPEHSPLFLANQYRYWYDAELGGCFYGTYASRRFTIVNPSAKKPAAAPALPKKPAVPYVVRDVCLGEDSGYVVLSREPVVGGSAKDGRGELRLFVRHPALFEDGPTPAVTVVAGRSSPGATDEPALVRSGRDLKLLRSGRDWALFSLLPDAGQVDPASVRVVMGPLTVEYGEGFGPAEQAGAQRWRWCRDRGVLTLYNSTEAPRKVKISALLQGRGDAPLVLDGGPLHAEASPKMNPTGFKRELTLPPGVHEIRFSTNASPYAAPPQSEHPLYVRLINLKVTDLGASPGGRAEADAVRSARAESAPSRR